jgi:hypothetical protein
MWTRPSLVTGLGLGLAVLACAAPRPPDAPIPVAPPLPAAVDRFGDNAATVRVGDAEGELTHLCADPVLSEQLTTGGEPVTRWVPCWHVADAAETGVTGVAREDVTAIAEGADDVTATAGAAGGERVAADPALVECAGVGEPELARAPLDGREVVAVHPERDAGRARGVRIVLAAERDVSALGLARLIRCHQARFVALGAPADYPISDPTLVAGGAVEVRELAGGRLEVVVMAAAPADAEHAIARAAALAARDRDEPREQTARP